MNRILILGTLAVASCLSLNSVANAAPVTANSVSTTSIAAACAITGEDANLVTTATITAAGADFPIELSSSGGTGKFTTLCNKATTAINIKAVVSHTVSGGTDATNKYSLSATGTSAYVGNAILGEFSGGTTKNGTISHGFSSTPSALLVSTKVRAATGEVLADGDYKITITATLTP